MPIALTLVIYTLAVVRVVGFLTKDELLGNEEERAAFELRVLGGAPTPWWRRKAAYLVTCPWCVSIYVGAAGALVWYHLGDNPWALVPAVALAMSQVTGMLASVGRGD